MLGGLFLSLASDGTGTVQPFIAVLAVQVAIAAGGGGGRRRTAGLAAAWPQPAVPQRRAAH